MRLVGRFAFNLFLTDSFSRFDPEIASISILCIQSTDPLPYESKDWPSKEECDNHVQKFPTWNEFPTTYMSPENKGFE